MIQPPSFLPLGQNSPLIIARLNDIFVVCTDEIRKAERRTSGETKQTVEYQKHYSCANTADIMRPNVIRNSDDFPIMNS
jgi:hypothetical protein